VKLLIVDRDGVISRDPDGRTASAESWQSEAGSAAALGRLGHGGWRVAVLADSGPLVRGSCDMAALNALHGRMIDEIVEAGGSVDAIVFVPPADTPGRADLAAASLEDLLSRMGASPAETVLVADSQPDLDAAHAAGCRPVLVLTGRGRSTFAANRLPPGTLVRTGLAALAAELAP
jgi:D-glycero-D-manno-heptose 1,7-bisphosphate phosphatase